MFDFGKPSSWIYVCDAVLACLARTVYVVVEHRLQDGPELPVLLIVNETRRYKYSRYQVRNSTSSLPHMSHQSTTIALIVAATASAGQLLVPGLGIIKHHPPSIRSDTVVNLRQLVPTHTRRVMISQNGHQRLFPRIRVSAVPEFQNPNQAHNRPNLNNGSMSSAWPGSSVALVSLMLDPSHVYPRIATTAFPLESWNHDRVPLLLFNFGRWARAKLR